MRDPHGAIERRGHEEGGIFIHVEAGRKFSYTVNRYNAVSVPRRSGRGPEGPRRPQAHLNAPKKKKGSDKSITKTTPVDS